MRNWAGSPASSLDTDTIVAPLAFEARFGATLSVMRLVAPAPTAIALNVWAPKPGAWMVHVVAAGDELRREAAGRRRPRQRRDAGLEVADDHARAGDRAPLAASTTLPTSVPLRAAAGWSKAGLRIGVVAALRRRRRARAAVGEGRPDGVEVVAVVAVEVGGQDAVARVEERRVGRGQRHPVGDEAGGDVGARRAAPYFATSALRRSHSVAVQISPSAWTSGPVRS